MPDADDAVAILTGLIQLVLVQLAEAWAEVRDQNTYGLALAGLGVAIMGIVVSAQNVLGSTHNVLGTNLWWVPIPGLVLATLLALRVTSGGQSQLGPSTAAFYATYGDDAGRKGLEQLLANLIDTLSAVPEALEAQRRRLFWVVVTFAATAAYSTALLA